MQKHVKLVRSSAGIAMCRNKFYWNQSIGQAWGFRAKDQSVFAGAFVKQLESFRVPSYFAMGQISHGADNSIIMYIYST